MLPTTEAGAFITGIKSCKNHRFVCADGDRSSYLLANREWYQQWEHFTLVPVDRATGTYAIRAHFNGKFVSVGQDELLTPSRDEVDLWETFRLHYLDEQVVAFRSLKNGKWVCVEDVTIGRGGNPAASLTLANALTATRDEIGEWEKFYFATG